jgi:TolB-like protein/Flp pilus assembly protein TadD
MHEQSAPDVKFEIGHVLFIDIVGYSKLLIDAQSKVARRLNEIVQNTNRFREAASDGKLLQLPTGDGMALVFRDSPESPAQCAIEIQRALRSADKIPVRMGIHNGPVNEIRDVNDRANIAGAGINMAQRVMGCGDAGHILLSKHVAEDLETHPRWRPHLYDLGECETKHGVRISLVNLCSPDFGNEQLPEKILRARLQQAADEAQRRHKRALVSVAIPLLAAAVLGWFISLQRRANSASIPTKSIAVLPFENLSANQENAFFADGVQDEILTDLAKIADLKVISRTSVMSYRSRTSRNVREIGKQLGVAHLLEGSVQRAAGKVRVIAELIDARNDAHLWAQTYDRDLADVFAIQSDIAESIADQLKARLSPAEKVAIGTPPTRDVTAYDLFIRAQGLASDMTNQVAAKANFPKGIELLQQAIARDPKFIRARCLLSRVHGQLYFSGFDHTPERLARAKVAAEGALQLDPSSGEAHLAMADYYYHGFRSYKDALNELALARQTLPNNSQIYEWSAYIGRRQGNWEEATRNFEKAFELDPRNYQIIQQLALAYQAKHRYQDQLRAYDRSLTIVPDDLSTMVLRAWVPADWRADLRPFQVLLATYAAKDPTTAAQMEDINYALCERTPEAVARTLLAYPPDGNVYNGVKFPRAYWEGVIARWQGEKEKARAAFTNARNEVEPLVSQQPDFAAALSLLGLIDAGLGQKEAAINEGRRACDLVPMAKDAVDGVAYAANLGQIYTWTNEKDRAIDRLTAVESVPNFLSYGYLKLQPLWDPLRGDPRFEQLLASLAPKD